MPHHDAVHSVPLDHLQRVVERLSLREGRHLGVHERKDVGTHPPCGDVEARVGPRRGFHEQQRYPLPREGVPELLRRPQDLVRDLEDLLDQRPREVLRADDVHALQGDEALSHLNPPGARDPEDIKLFSVWP
jgi:hypothetical protein